MSIWDKPQPVGAAVNETTTPDSTPRPTATVDPNLRLFGTEDGPLWQSGGYGVRNGIPYGENRREAAAALNLQYALRPTWRARLVAKTRAALGG